MAAAGHTAEKVQDVSPPVPSRATHVTLAFVPRGTDVEELAEAGLSPGLLSAGMGSVPAEQTYLDITQGNRVFDLLYDSKLPERRAGESCSAWWREVVERADSAPADIVPGLLIAALKEAGKEVRVDVGGLVGVRAACTFSLRGSGPAAHASPKKLSEAPRQTPAPVFEVQTSSIWELPGLVNGLQDDDLLIAIEKPPPPESRALAIGIAGRGFDGNLTSDSTRLDGYVLTTDLAPTILARFGVAVPSEMTGEPIRSEGEVDAAAVASLGDRLAAIPERRGPVIGLALIAWSVALGLAMLLSRGRVARFGVRLAAISLVFLPLLLLLSAALEPSLHSEQLLVILGSPVLGLLTLVALRGYRALAVASGTTVLVYTAALLAGSSLPSLSLVGPNPGLGARFFGIGNELEAILAVLVIAGTGAALAGLMLGRRPRRAAACFLTAGLFFALVFAAGRFGADVGAAIVLPFGSAVAAAAIAAPRRRAALWVGVVPIAAVALLALVDLVSGGNAHLTRSVLDAGGLGDLADVAQRRLELSAHSFGRPIVVAVMPLVLAIAAVAILRRERIAAWMRASSEMRAGLLGALAAVLIGALVNDSGALIVEIGAAYLLAFAGFAWAESGHPDTARPIL
ncbi:MAG TPA: hypothetical protein VIE64_10000 [Solirubrobacterales bacterium]